MESKDRQRRIAELNDRLRKRTGLPANGDGDTPQGLVVTTRGIFELPFGTQADILARVRSFDTFTEDNDPHGEHDFGAFDVQGVGKFFWKIDYYADRNCAYGSEDPSDPEKSFRVLTIMKADEY